MSYEFLLLALSLQLRATRADLQLHPKQTDLILIE